MNAKTQAAVQKHGETLLAIFPGATERNPITLCKKLRKQEARGAWLGMRLCNGPEFKEEEAEDYGADILAKVDKLLQFKAAGVPVSVNRDPRGYALKIESEWLAGMIKPCGWNGTQPIWEDEKISPHCKRMHRDFGGYGILAPDLTEK